MEHFPNQHDRHMYGNQGPYIPHSISAHPSFYNNGTFPFHGAVQRQDWVPCFQGSSRNFYQMDSPSTGYMSESSDFNSAEIEQVLIPKEELKRDAATQTEETTVKLTFEIPQPVNKKNIETVDCRNLIRINQYITYTSWLNVQSAIVSSNYEIMEEAKREIIEEKENPRAVAQRYGIPMATLRSAINNYALKKGYLSYQVMLREKAENNEEIQKAPKKSQNKEGHTLLMTLRNHREDLSTHLPEELSPKVEDPLKI